MKPKFPQVTILNSQIRTLHSAPVHDDYDLSIWLPPSYDTTNQQYPVLYLLDAPLTFDLAVQIILGQIWDALVPEMVVVGIGKHVAAYDEWWPIRGRDYAPVPLPSQPGSGSGSAFLQFIKSELRPFICANFHVDPNDGTLWGHSLGGAFVLFALFKQPDLFNRYIATSPAVVEAGTTLIDYDVDLPAPGSSIPARLFVSVGSMDYTYRPHIEAFINAMRNKMYRNLEIKSAVLEGVAHTSALPLGFIEGLRAVFAGRT